VHKQVDTTPAVKEVEEKDTLIYESEQVKVKFRSLPEHEEKEQEFAPAPWEVDNEDNRDRGNMQY
jgi:hypothetical protein